MADYNSNYTGQQIDEAVGKALNPDSSPTSGSQSLVTSGGVAAGLAQKASASDVNAMAEKIPSGASSSNKLVTQADIANFITRSVNDLVNYYLKSDTYTKQEVQALIAAINQFHYEVYESLSDVTSPASNVLYLIGPTGSGSDKYEEYVWPNATLGFVKIGDTSIDLSGYVTTQALNAALATKVNISDIVDNLTTDDATKVLSAKQGKALDGKVNQLGQKQNYGIPFTAMPNMLGWPGQSGWGNFPPPASRTAYHHVIPISGGETIFTYKLAFSQIMLSSFSAWRLIVC